MQVDAEMLSKAMEKQEIAIEFVHYKTKEVLRVRGTLNPAVTGSKIVDQHPESEVVVLWDVDNKEWKSIYVNTIIGLYKYEHD